MAEFPAGEWEVKGWITAPGDFPALVLNWVRVAADDLQAAHRAGHHRLAAGSGTDPVVVSVRRLPLNPPNVEASHD
jgi:hypothetical protein